MGELVRPDVDSSMPPRSRPIFIEMIATKMIATEMIATDIIATKMIAIAMITSTMIATQCHPCQRFCDQFSF